MKRKISCILILSALIISLTGCTLSEKKVEENKSDTTTAETTVAETTETTEITEMTEATVVFEKGVVEGNTYENKMIGIGCTLNEEWFFYTEEEMSEKAEERNDIVASASNNTVDLTSGDLHKDMMAEHIEGAFIGSINILAEKPGSFVYTVYDEKQILEASQTQVEELLVNMYKNAGFEKVVVSSEVSTINIDGEEFCSLSTTTNLNDSIDFYQFQIIKKFGDGCLATITISSSDKDIIKEVIDSFYIVK